MDMEQDNSDNPAKNIDEHETESAETTADEGLTHDQEPPALEDDGRMLASDSDNDGDHDDDVDSDEPLGDFDSDNSTDQLLEASGLIEDIEPSAEPVVTEDELLALSDTIVADLSALDQIKAEEAAAAATASKTPVFVSEEQKAFVTAAMETLIFMSDKPMSLPKLRSLIDSTVPLNMYRELMTKLRAEFAEDHRGIEIAEVSMGFQLRTKPQMAPVLRKLVKTTPLKLTGAMMELLAVVAYKQPVTKDDVDQVRGVDCGYLLRNLMEKRLIRITGRSDLPGRPILYGTTHEFLELFSLKDTSGLPPLHEIESMVAASEVGAEDKEVQDMQTFGKMVDASLSTKLFDDSNMDSELEDIRRAIDSIPVSTSFLDEQKAREKLLARLAELNARGLSLDAEGNEVPADTVPEGTVELLLEKIREKYHQPAEDLAAAAEAARQQRLDEILNETEAAPAEEAPAPVVEATETSLEAATTAFDNEAPYEPEIELPEVNEADAYEDSVINGPTESSLDAVPSELEVAAEQARQERHAAMIEKATQDLTLEEDQESSTGTIESEPTSH